MHRDFINAAPEGFNAVGEITHACILCACRALRQVGARSVELRVRCVNEHGCGACLDVWIGRWDATLRRLCPLVYSVLGDVAGGAAAPLQEEMTWRM